MSQCNYHPYVNAFVDGELDADTQRRFEEHLPGCGSCAQEVEELRELSGLLQAGPAEPIRPDELGRLHQKIDDAGNMVITGAFFRTAGLLCALAASILIICSVWMADGPRSQESPARATVVSAPDWERVAVTLHAEPRWEIRSGEPTDTATADAARLTNWMVESLRGKDR